MNQPLPVTFPLCIHGMHTISVIRSKDAKNLFSMCFRSPSCVSADDLSHTFDLDVETSPEVILGTHLSSAALNSKFLATSFRELAHRIQVCEVCVFHDS